MNKQTLNQSRLDAARLESAADRIRDLRDAYMNTLDDLRIAQQGLKIIATWSSANCFRFDRVEHDVGHIHDRAMDTLSLISEANRG